MTLFWFNLTTNVCFRLVWFSLKVIFNNSLRIWKVFLTVIYRISTRVANSCHRKKKKREKCYLFFQYLLICVFFFNEYFDWKKNLSFSSVKSYFQILPLIKFTNILKMAQFLYGSIILRNINVMLHFMTFSLGVEHSYMANGTFWDF